MAIIKSYSPFQNLANFTTFVTDTNPNSDFFRITEFKETFTGGKNGFLIEGSDFLKETTEVKIEILDVEGNPIYYEPGKGTPEYYEGLSTLVSVHIYPDTPIGVGKITILGELKEYIDANGTRVPVPEEWKGVYNVKWQKTFKINRNLNNEDIVRFYRRPVVSISELVKPIFSKTIPSVTKSGSLDGIALQPSSGSDLTTWTAGTLYKLKLTSGDDFTGSIDENIISIPSLGYSPTVKEVLNSREVLVDVPYTSNNIVQNFSSQDFESTFEYVEGQTVSDSALTGSFARINFSNLKTFVGDVARVKVFRKSRNEVTDYQFVQESKLESSELLRDVTVSNDTEISYGNFTQDNLYNYWVSSSIDHPITVNVDVLQSSAKTDYNSTVGGVQHLITSESFSITKDVEYTLTFKTLVSGSLNGSEYLRAYLSSSDGYQQTFLTVSGSDVYKTRQTVSQNIIANPISSSDAHLVFEISGSDWYVSNVSLRNAQETSFSPDEFVLIQDIPRKLATETFDFRFEFYDINNNYIPVDVKASAVFDGGNDFPTSGKLLTFESDRNAFRFSTGSIQNPENQVVKFSVTQQNLTGSLTFASQAYDVNGDLLDPADYSQYPGFLTSVTPAGALLTINNFTGSYSGTPPAPFVGSIVYTASLDSLEEYETVYRLEDGENAPTLIVTSDANQFIYEPTKLSPKPSGQSITIRAQRKNLASYNTPITVNSGSNYPPLNVGATNANGVTTYTISATEFSSSFSANNFDSVTYSFTGSDVYGNDYSDEVTLSKVVNFDGVSIVLTNEATSFPANSTGQVTGGFVASSGSVQMYIGGTQITHDDEIGGRSKNTFNITSSIGTNVTPTDTTPNTANYSISAFETTKDSGSLTLTIDYLAGDNSTTQSFQKVVSYTKAKKAVPTVLTKISPSTQTINSSSAGFETPQTMDVILQEGGTEYTYSGTLASNQSFKINSISVTSGSVSNSNETITLGSITSSNFVGLLGSASIDYKDSEGTTVTNKLVRFDLSVSKIGVDGVNGSNGTDSNTVSLSANQYTIPYDGDGNESGTNTIELTATTNATGSVYYQFRGSNDGGTTWTYQPQNSTKSTYILSQSQEPGVGEGWLWQVDVRDGSESGSVLAFDNTDLFGLKEGSNAYTVFLTNEAHTYISDSSGLVTQSIADGAFETRVFRGTTQYTYDGSSPYDVNSYRVSFSATGITGSASTVSSQRKWTPSGVNGVIDAGNVAVTIIDNATGTTFDKTYTYTKSKKGKPSVVAVLSSEAQTITKTAGGTYGTPSTFTVSVNEGGINYTYDAASPYSNGSFRISSITGGTNSTNTVTPTTPTTDAGTTVSMTISYVNSDGVAGTITKTHKVGVTTDGVVGANGVTIVPSLTSQNVVRDLEAGTFTSVSSVSHAVTQGSTTFSSVASGTALSDSTYRVKAGSLTNCTETANGVITPTQPSSGTFATGGTASYTIEYKDSSGNVNEIAFSHVVNVTYNGTTGPGVVFSGEWASGIYYQFSTGATGRRDAVIYGGTYYATTAAHTSTTTGTTGPPGVGSNWESLGSGTRFSAAEISLSKDSYIDSTLNIGSNTTAFSTANITLASNSGNPYFSLGQSSAGVYGATGIFIGNDSGNYRASFVNGTTSYLKWTGTGLDIKGSITVTGGDAATNSDVESVSLSAMDLQLSANMVIENGRELRKTGGTNNSWSEQAYSGVGFKDGAFVSFKINAPASGRRFMMGLNSDPTTDTSYTSLDYCWYMNQTSYAIYQNNTSLTPDTSLPTPVSGDILSVEYDGDKVRWYINNTLYNTEDVNSGLTLHLDSSFYNNTTTPMCSWFDFGPLGQKNSSAKSDGTVGGWTITSSAIHRGTVLADDTFATANGQITLGAGYIGAKEFKIASNGSATFKGAITGGSININSGQFSVNSSGVLNATGATIGGTINASGGTFTNDITVNGKFVSGNAKFGQNVSGTNDGIYLASGNYWYDNGAFAVGDGSTKGIVWNPGSSTLTIGGDVNIGTSIASALLANGSNISQLNNDSLYQANSDAKTAGTVGGWDISSSAITSNNGRITFSNSPYIGILDTSNNVKVQIRTGGLTPLTGGATTTIPARSATSWSSYPTSGVTAQAIFGSSTTFTPASTGVYSATVTCGAVGQVCSWTSGFSGYIQVKAYIQIANNSSFSGATNVTLLSAGYYPTGASGSISFSSGGSAIWLYNFASTSTHYVRMVWERTVQGSGYSYTSFAAQTVTSAASNGSTTIDQVELTDVGFQVVKSSSYYFKVEREGYGAGGVYPPFAQVGGDLSATGNIISYYSDGRLKNILGLIENPLDKIKKLNGIYYTKNEKARELGMINESNDGKVEVGLIAQEVEEVLPEIVHLAPIDMDDKTGESKTGENYLTIDYDRVVPLLVESVKELTSKVEKLEEENKRLRDATN